MPRQSPQLAAAVAAQAQLTYTYTGNNYTFLEFEPTPGIEYSQEMSVSGSFETANTLGQSFSFKDISNDLVAFSFFDGVNTITNETPGVVINTFEVGTDVSGQISDWNIEVVIPFSVPPIRPPRQRTCPCGSRREHPSCHPRPV